MPTRQISRPHTITNCRIVSLSRKGVEWRPPHQLQGLQRSRPSWGKTPPCLGQTRSCASMRSALTTRCSLSTSRGAPLVRRPKMSGSWIPSAEEEPRSSLPDFAVSALSVSTPALSLSHLPRPSSSHRLPEPWPIGATSFYTADIGRETYQRDAFGTSPTTAKPCARSAACVNNFWKPRTTRSRSLFAQCFWGSCMGPFAKGVPAISLTRCRAHTLRSQNRRCGTGERES